MPFGNEVETLQAFTLTTAYPAPVWRAVDAPLAGGKRAACGFLGANALTWMYDSEANGLKRVLGMKTASPQDAARHPYTSVAVVTSSRRRVPGWKGEASL
jgi:hypothetical protein